MLTEELKATYARLRDGCPAKVLSFMLYKRQSGQQVVYDQGPCTPGRAEFRDVLRIVGKAVCPAWKDSNLKTDEIRLLCANRGSAVWLEEATTVLP